MSRTPEHVRERAAELAETGASKSAISRELGISRATVARIMNAPRKRYRKVREGDEFPLGSLLSSLVTPPRDTGSGVYAWDLPQIRAARDLQLTGDFCQPVRMAASMRTNYALFAPYDTRLSSLRSIAAAIEPAPGGRQAEARRIAGEAEALYGPEGVAATEETLASIRGDRINHGVGIGYVVPQPRPDGSRVDLFLTHWPLDTVRYDKWDRQLKARVELTEGSARPRWFDVPITHGDGRWVVFASHECEPWRQDAALLSASLVWAANAVTLRDWSKASTAHGNAKAIAEMPENTPLRNKDASLTLEARDMLELGRAIVNLSTPFGVIPHGSKLHYLVNNSTAWQVWKELEMATAKAAARIYLGTDAILGAQGGAPGVDITQLFGVATTKIQGDLRCEQRALQTGLIEPWCAINFGDSSLAPRRVYQIPDADEEAIREKYAARAKAFHEEIAAYRNNGFILDQAAVDEIADKYGVRAPKLDPDGPPEPVAQPAPEADDEEGPPASGDQLAALRPLKGVT